MSAEQTPDLQLVTFLLADVRYALDVTRIQEIVRMPPVTRVPRAPRHVAGVTNLRGHVIPVVDMRRRFGMPGREADAASRVVVVAREGGAVGFVVDAVAEILRLPASAVAPGATLGSMAASEWISGVGKLEDRLILLVDLDKLLQEGPLAAPETTSPTLPATPEDDRPASPQPRRPRLRLAA